MNFYSRTSRLSNSCYKTVMVVNYLLTKVNHVIGDEYAEGEEGEMEEEDEEEEEEEYMEGEDGDEGDEDIEEDEEDLKDKHEVVEVIDDDDDDEDVDEDVGEAQAMEDTPLEEEEVGEEIEEGVYLSLLVIAS